MLDNIELKDGAVVLSASSSARGERERAILADALAGLVGAPLTEIQTVEQMHASRRACGRRDLVVWLKHLENRSSHTLNPGDPMSTYDFTWL